MQNCTSCLHTLLLKEKTTFVGYVLITFIVFSALGTALSFAPANSDDLVLLSSVANTQSPITFFTGDWGLGNNAYRPLHSLTLWFTYHLFGVSAGLNQGLNLLLHSAIICLLYRLILRVHREITISFLLASLSIASIYTVSSETWVSDRPTLFVAFFFLLLLNHLYYDGSGHIGRLPYIIMLSVLDLMSKESGLVVPLFAIYYGFQIGIPANYRARIVIISTIIIIIYLVFRLAIFGTQANAYQESGYILACIRYEEEEWSTLPKSLQYYAYVENTIKNMMAPFIPVFNDQGGLTSLRRTIVMTPFWLPTVLLVLLSIGRNFSTLQKAALITILLNSVVHHAVFRYRVEFLSQLAVSIFIASSPAINRTVGRSVLVKILASALLFSGICWSTRSLDATLLARHEMLNVKNLAPIIQRTSLEKEDKVVREVLERYKAF